MYLTGNLTFIVSSRVLLMSLLPSSDVSALLMALWLMPVDRKIFSLVYKKMPIF